ncbi:MAG: glycogen synthase [Candidatus Calescibacterium sp.]|nr:glycogen synthase [Candidatus Calescibacterium sp.]
MKVAMISLEMVPFSKVGGLADVIGSLPKSLPIKTAVITPYYGNITNNLYSKFSDQELKLEPIKTLNVLNHQIEICKTIYNNVDVFLICNRELFEREGIYLDKSGKPFEDEILRYYVFSRAAIEIASEFDVIHCHDWHTSFVIILAKLKNLKNTIFTIHNIAYQGVVEKESIQFLSDDIKNLLFEYGEYHGKINLMKAAIILSDIVSTVSPTYAYEIQNFSHFGMGLENVLKQNSHKIMGILNGIDNELWNPQTDKHIYYNYSSENLEEGKKINREKLLKEFNLKNANILFGIVARLDYQKGFDILHKAVENLTPGTFNLLVLGTGNPEIQKSILELSERYPEFIKVNITFDEVLARKIYAASDYFIIPSRFEPCGLSQMISYRYGTIPIATKTGGLKDSIIDIFENPSCGTGILIENADPNLLSQSIKKAIEINRLKLTEIQKRVMGLDFSWNNSAKEYIKMYEKILTLKS